MLPRLRKIFQAKPSYAVIIVGTEFESYQLLEKLQHHPRVSVAFLMNEEPWAHRTYLHEVELRYPSELVSLVAKHKIAAVLCPSQSDYHRYQKDYQATLAAKNTVVREVSASMSAEAIYELIETSVNS
jgi:FlaA1/EpsC-like NDP-sugar epimerase